MPIQTLYDKLFSEHVVDQNSDGRALLYIDRHLLHEVTSPQAFQGLNLAKRPVWRQNSCLAVPDHNVPTTVDRYEHIADPLARTQLQVLAQNCAQHEITYIPIHNIHQGIVHVIGPELGATLPGMTIVCGDSHTSTHGAFAAIAMGIGTSEVEHVLATQCLWANKMKNMLINCQGQLSEGVSAKDLILALIGQLGTAGGTGYALEFQGAAISKMSMAGRMTLCNMGIEAGSRVALVAVDETTLSYVEQTPYAPKGEQWAQAKQYWQTLHSDASAVFDHEVTLDCQALAPQVTWGTSPEMVLSVNDSLPSLDEAKDKAQAISWKNAYEYMGLQPNQRLTDIAIDTVFIGSCTNSRLEDLQQAADIVKDQKVADSIKQAIVVPGSGVVKQQAEALGLDEIFRAAGFEWREPGCSMCIAMNPDRLAPGERAASTSNRNFEGRQGKGGRTHLVSPQMAAASAIHGHFVDVRSKA